MTARATWKARERRIATDLGGQRIPVTGVDRDGADVITPLFHVQAKLRKSLPTWLWLWLTGIVSTTPKDKVGILVLMTPGQDQGDAIVALRYKDFVDLHGRIDGRD
tara:strand:+ start:4436 stop:4753 length:318 start_codon:yes stop_codon:yes gene_type:complete